MKFGGVVNIINPARVAFKHPELQFANPSFKHRIVERLHIFNRGTYHVFDAFSDKLMVKVLSL